MPNLNTETEVRDFLLLALTPGHGIPPRTVAKVAKIMPDWLQDAVAAQAPHLAELRTAVDTARTTYVEALNAWIHPTNTEPAQQETPSNDQ